MSVVTSFNFNAFQENTYILHDKGTDEAVIIDPGCHDASEKEELLQHINENKMRVVGILNTHCHVDHVFGNAFTKQMFPNAPLYVHNDELPILKSYPAFAAMYGLTAEPSPKPDAFLADGDSFTFGNTSLKVCLTPGHSPGSISFYCKKDRYIIGGDVLFYLSIGRTDLPGGDFDTLIASIERHFLSLPDNVKVYSGHGQTTSIGYERHNNPFLKH